VKEVDGILKDAVDSGTNKVGRTELTADTLQGMQFANEVYTSDKGKRKSSVDDILAERKKEKRIDDMLIIDTDEVMAFATEEKMGEPPKKSKKTLVVVFRGTHETKDWLVNTNSTFSSPFHYAMPRPRDAVKLQVNEAHKDRVRPVVLKILEHIHDIEFLSTDSSLFYDEISVYGHSLGGALASVFVLLIKSQREMLTILGVEWNKKRLSTGVRERLKSQMESIHQKLKSLPVTLQTIGAPAVVKWRENLHKDLGQLLQEYNIHVRMIINGTDPVARVGSVMGDDSSKKDKVWDKTVFDNLTVSQLRKIVLNLQKWNPVSMFVHEMMKTQIQSVIEQITKKYGTPDASLTSVLSDRLFSSPEVNDPTLAAKIPCAPVVYFYLKGEIKCTSQDHTQFLRSAIVHPPSIDHISHHPVFSLIWY
jgi:hypothetical protein